MLNEGQVKEKLWEVANFETKEQKRDFLGALNEWYPFPERFHSYQLLCAGFDVMEPWLDIEDGRVVYSYHIKETPINMDHWCEHTASYKQNPRIILETKKDSVMKTMDSFQNEEFYYFILHFVHTFSRQIDHLEWHQRGMTPLVAYFSSIPMLIDWCNVNHPEYYLERCALAYLHEYQPFDETGNFYGNFSDVEIA